LRSGKVGTTGRGIGPCYMDRVGRFGVRMGDLRFPDLVREKVEAGMKVARSWAEMADTVLDLDEGKVVEDVLDAGNRLKAHIIDTPALLNNMVKEGKKVLLEGAQGQMLDIDRGTYPFVTSSSCTVGNASSGSGLGIKTIGKVYGVVKAYTTRVGEGPFPTELVDGTGEHLRDVGNEFGTTTSRPRRCGWLDLVVVRSSVRWNSIDTLALTKLDVLDGLDAIMVCTHYLKDGAELDYFPSHLRDLERCIPVYVTLKGWGRPDWEKGIVPGVESYIKLIEEQTGARVGIVSYGPGREQTMFR